MHLLKPLLAILGSFSLGYTFKEIVTWVLRMYRSRRERRMDDEIITYLVAEWNANTPTHNGYGQQSLPFRSTLQISEAVGMSAVEVRERLSRLEAARRVDRPGPQSEVWIVTNLELHDSQRRRRRWRF